MKKKIFKCLEELFFTILIWTVLYPTALPADPVLKEKQAFDFWEKDNWEVFYEWQVRLALWQGKRRTEMPEGVEIIQDQDLPRPGIFGKVYYKKTILCEREKETVRGVDLTLQGCGLTLQQKAGENGEFRFLNLFAGNYVLLAELDGFYTLRAEIDYKGGEKVFLACTMKMGDTGQIDIPAKKLDVAYWKTYWFFQPYLKGDWGRTSPPSEIHQPLQIIDFKKLGIFPQKGERTTIKGSVAMVHNEDSKLPGVLVTLSDNLREWQDVAGENGEFQFRGIPAGTYSLRAEGSLQFDSQMICGISLCEGDTLHIDINLPGTQRINVSPIFAKPLKFISEKEPDLEIRAVPDADFFSKAALLKSGEAFNLYRRERHANWKTPAFFQLWADFFFRHGAQKEGLQVLADYEKLASSTSYMLRGLALRLWGQQRWEWSRRLLEQAWSKNRQNPETARDLAINYIRMGLYQQAASLFSGLLFSNSLEKKLILDNDQSAVKLFVLTELNQIRDHVKGRENAANSLPKELQQKLDCDLRLVLLWDNSCALDADLIVEEPNGHRSDFSEYLTPSGGICSPDSIAFGPEEYLLKKAAPGKYSIRVRYRTAETCDPEYMLNYVYLLIYRDWGRPQEKLQVVSKRLPLRLGELLLGEIDFK